MFFGVEWESFYISIFIRNSVKMSSGVSDGMFKKLMCRSLGFQDFLVPGEKLMVNDRISSGLVQSVSIICFVPNSMETKFWLEDI